MLLHANQTSFKKGQIPWNKGRRMSPEAREKMRQAKLKNPVRYWLGKERPEAAEWIRKANLGRPSKLKGIQLLHKRGENNPAWKGEKVSYRNLHRWVEREVGKPSTCEHCHTDGLTGHSIHWANKSGNYKRELTDWLRLCAKCHKTYDRAVQIGL